MGGGIACRVAVLLSLLVCISSLYEDMVCFNPPPPASPLPEVFFNSSPACSVAAMRVWHELCTRSQDPRDRDLGGESTDHLSVCRLQSSERRAHGTVPEHASSCSDPAEASARKQCRAPTA